MLHSPKDITRWWEQRDDKKHKAEFELGVNMFIYNAGKNHLRNRIETAWVPPLPASVKPLATVKVARLEYPGNTWDPEPGAWRRYANWFQRQTSYALDVTTVKAADLKPGDGPGRRPDGHGQAEPLARDGGRPQGVRRSRGRAAGRRDRRDGAVRADGQ